jgi:hypothetical protein
LAVDRVEKTPELFPPNDFYGHASVLKRYCGLPSDFQIPAVLPHGVSINHSTWQVELDAPYPSIFAISEEQRLKYADITDKRVYVIGSVMHYAERLIADEINEIRSAAEGTVAFPAHSTHHLTADFDQTAFIDSLQDLPVEMKPVRVCLYWRDIQLKRHLKYMEAGFEFILLLAELSAIGFRLQVKRVNLLDHSETDLRIVVSAQLQKEHHKASLSF